MMKKIIITTLVCAFGSVLFAQSHENAKTWANQNFYGTARASAMGGAFSSLGGDVSVLSTNPAGLGIYRSSEFSATLGNIFTKVSGDGKLGEKSNFIMPSIGFVLATESASSEEISWNFAIAYNRAANFNFKEKFQSLGSEKSLLDDIVYDANNSFNSKTKKYEFNPYNESDLEKFRPLEPSLAYKTFLITKDTKDRYSNPWKKREFIDRFSSIEDEGNSGEIALSFAGNYEDHVYFGASVGFQSINYKHVDKYDEVNANPDKESLLKSFYYDKEQETVGTGLNLKLGVILRPIDPLRLAFSIHTPTYYSLENKELYTMSSEFYKEPEKGVGVGITQHYPENGEAGFYEYNYRTPWKFTFGGSFVFGKIGLLSIDYDLVDYSGAKFSSPNDDFSSVNELITDTYKLAGNLKVGTEVRVLKQFSLRAGYNHFGNMYQKHTGIKEVQNMYSAGIGFRYKNIFVDASFQRYANEKTVKQDEFAYLKNTNTNVVKLTFGMKF